MASLQTTPQEGTFPAAEAGVGADQASEKGQAAKGGAGVPPNSEPALVTWTCAACTWQNADIIPVCNACKKPRGFVPPAQQAGAVGEDQMAVPNWTCEKCTFVNGGLSEVCAMCEEQADDDDSQQLTIDAKNVNKDAASKQQGGPGSGGVEQEEPGAEVAAKEGPVLPNWTCNMCTYENEGLAEVCAMCEKLKVEPDAQAGKGMSTPEEAPSNIVPAKKENQGGADSADIEEVGAEKQPEAQQETNAAGLKETEGPQEEEQKTEENSNKEAGTEEQHKEPEPVRWSCQLCTFENIEPDISCQICTSPRPASDKERQPEDPAVPSRNMCSMCGLIKPFGQPWKGGLCTSCRPVVEDEQPMEVQGTVIPEAGPSCSAPEPGPCGMCEKVVPGALLERISSCGHAICCSCVSTLMQQRVKNACPASSACHQDILALLKCWEPGCHHLFGSGCLSSSLSSPAFLALSNWLLTVLSGLYSHSKAPSLESSLDDRTVAASSADLEFVCIAEDCFLKACPQTCKTLPAGDSSSRVWAFCDSCPQVTCLACGQLAGTSVDDEFRTHRFACPLVQTFEVFHALVDFEEAFTANEAGGREGQDEGDDRSNKKQRTDQGDAGRKRIVWAKGTGFGGGGNDYDEPYAYPDEEEEEEDEGFDEDEEAAEDYEEMLGGGCAEPPPEDPPEDEDMAIELAQELAAQVAGEEILGGQKGGVGEGAQIQLTETEGMQGPVAPDVEVPPHENHVQEATPGSDGGANGQAVLAGTLSCAIQVALAAIAPPSGLSPLTPSSGEAPAKPATSPHAAAATHAEQQSSAPGQEASGALQTGEAPLVSDVMQMDAEAGQEVCLPSSENTPMEVGTSTAEAGPPSHPPAAFDLLHLPQPPGHAGPFPTPPLKANVPGPSDKRKERKDKEEEREEKLRKRERQADLNLTCAAAALTEALQGDEFMPRPNAGTAALLHASCARRILYSVLHRCSLLDMGHHVEREQLYLTVMHLIRTLGAHSDLLPVLLCDKDDEEDKDSWQQRVMRTNDLKRPKGLLSFAFSGIGRALATRREKGKSPEAEEAGSADVMSEQGIRANPAVKELRIGLEGGKSVLGALGDLNRQARIVQQGLKNGMVEGEGEADFGVGIVGLVLEVSDRYEELSRRAAHWDSARHEAREERAALLAMEVSAQETEGGADKEGVQQASHEAGPTESAQKADSGMEQADGMEVSEEEAARPKEEAAVAGSPAGKTPLKERVRKGLMGMLISRKKSGKSKETEPARTVEAPKTPSAADSKGKGEAVSKVAHIDAYKAALKALQFQEVSLLGEDGQYEHHFRNEAGTSFGEQSGSGAHSAKRQLRMLREIAALATTLPLEWESSVHIRVDESRMDLLKALIIGPEDTPYSNGMWMFDVLLTADYPERPPKVIFLTTGGGTVRFNPNLYNCGKVCLSLLGTWSGPSWQPGKSTLLQVLISLQSLIFVKEPYYNEPGYEARESSKASEAYNQDVRLNAMKHAILAPLKSPPRAFQDVVKQHFSRKRSVVAAQMDDWISRADKAHEDACTQVGAQIKEELAKLGKQTA